MVLVVSAQKNISQFFLTEQCKFILTVLGVKSPKPSVSSDCTVY